MVKEIMDDNKKKSEIQTEIPVQPKIIKEVTI